MIGVLPLCAIIFGPLAVDYLRFCDSIIGGSVTGNINIVSGQEHLPVDAREYEPVSATNLQDLRPLVIAEINASGDSGTMKFSPDSAILAMSTFSNMAPSSHHANYTLFWELVADEQPCFRRFQLPSTRPGDFYRANELLRYFSRSGDLVLTSSSDHCYYDGNCYFLRDVRSLRQLASFASAEFIPFPDGERMLYTLPDDPNTYLLDISEGFDLNRAEVLEVDNKPIRAFSPDGEKFAVQNEDGSYSIQSYGLPHNQIDIPGEMTKFARFSPDGKSIVLWLTDEIEIRDTASGEVRLSIERIGDAYSDFDPNSQYFAHGSTIWDLSSGEEILNLGEYRFRAYSPDGTLIQATDEDGGLVFLDAATGEPLRTIRPEGELLAMAFNEQHTLLAMITAEDIRDSTIALWAIPKG